MTNSNIIRTCNMYGITNYNVRPDGLVDILGDVDLSESKDMTHLPIRFGIVTGMFDCSDNKLTSFYGFPESVGKRFFVNYNRFTTLQGCPFLGENKNQLDNFFNFGGNQFPWQVEEFFLSGMDLDFIHFRRRLNVFLKYQDHFDIWSGGFNEDNFNLLMNEINDGLL